MHVTDISTVQPPAQSALTDKERINELYRAHHEVIWRTIRRMGFSPEAAADATHQAYVIAMERLDKIYLGSEKAYLFSTAIQLAKTTARRDRRMQLEEDIDLGPDPRSNSDSFTDRHMALQLLDRVLSRMNDDLVTVFALFELEGFSSPQIAELLGIPLGTVASRLRRARESFKAAALQLEKNSTSVPAPIEKRATP